MGLFVSYTRSDQIVARLLEADLERLGHKIWVDHQIHGGEQWWKEIVRQIQAADVLVFALSTHSLRSRPCREELSYAQALLVPVVPVQVGPLENVRIPLAEFQIIDYRERSADVVIELVTAISGVLAQPRRRPDPLPAPPEVPFEYLYRIAREIDVRQIPPDDQDRLVEELRRRLRIEDDDTARADIVSLLKELRGRGEITVRIAAEIDDILGRFRGSSGPANTQSWLADGPDAEAAPAEQGCPAERPAKPSPPPWWDQVARSLG